MGQINYKSSIYLSLFWLHIPSYYASRSKNYNALKNNTAANRILWQALAQSKSKLNSIFHFMDLLIWFFPPKSFVFVFEGVITNYTTSKKKLFFCNIFLF